MQAIIFCGIQGSGKSTFYKQHFFNSHIRISMDLLRTRNREMQMLQLCLRTKARFVVDNTNATRQERERYLNPAAAAGYERIGYQFITSVEAALQRNACRAGKEKIPDLGIWATYKKMEPLAWAEGFHKLYLVYPALAQQFVVEELQQAKEF